MKTKKNPFDTPPPPPRPAVYKPDANLQNADWPKRVRDVSADGSFIEPKVKKQ